MFTGIITDKGKVRTITPGGDTRFEFSTGFDVSSIDIGASICCSGACLTVVKKGDGWFGADVSAETLSKTTLGTWQEGTPVNFERALKLGDEMGGHIVSGHIDGVATLTSIADEGDSKRFLFEAPDDLKFLIAAKGSITLDGVSLTVNEVEGRRFGINVIAHTQEQTTLGDLKEGDRVNLEIDMLARYVARLQHKE
ncbi:MAG: riboflavin synthase [Proteobacteria bacterium]|nr:riboflavin synthase [Pseudomonadota bacterium]MDA1023198.1 riboflavin synthase [Pseudomonadota bacterium]